MNVGRCVAAVLGALALGYMAGCGWAAYSTTGASLLFGVVVSVPLGCAAVELWRGE